MTSEITLLNIYKVKGLIFARKHDESSLGGRLGFLNFKKKYTNLDKWICEIILFKRLRNLRGQIVHCKDVIQMFWGIRVK